MQEKYLRSFEKHERILHDIVGKYAFKFSLLVNSVLDNILSSILCFAWMLHWVYQDCHKPRKADNITELWTATNI